MKNAKPTPSLTDVAFERLHSQRLESPVPGTPAGVVSWLVAMQAQDYAGAKWSVGLRLPDATDAGIEQALADKTIIRTWAFRGTLHFVAAADVRWLLALAAPGVIRGRARRYRELELDERTLARSNDILAKAVSGGRQLNRAELFAILEKNGISPQGQRGVHMLQRASLDGLICHAALRRNQPVFMSLDAVPSQRQAMRRDEAAAELAGRYFTGRSPATLQDFIWYSGLPAAEARAGLEAVKAQFSPETIDGQTYWLSRALPKAKAGAPKTYLLPGFDEYLLSYKDRGASIDRTGQKKLAGLNGMLSPTILSGGRVVGTWKRTFGAAAVVISPTPFAPLSAAEKRALDAAAQRFGRFLGMPVHYAKA